MKNGHTYTHTHSREGVFCLAEHEPDTGTDMRQGDLERGWLSEVLTVKGGEIYGDIQHNERGEWDKKERGLHKLTESESGDEKWENREHK